MAEETKGGIYLKEMPESVRPPEPETKTWVSRYVGRKFIGFATASALLVFGLIGPDEWKFAFIVYCAADVVEKIGLGKVLGKKA